VSGQSLSLIGTWVETVARALLVLQLTQARQRAEHPGPQQVRGPEHHRHRRHLAEHHGPRPGRASGQRHRLGRDGLLVGEAETRQVLRNVAEGEIDVRAR
jgi:hypothetical protein